MYSRETMTIDQAASLTAQCKEVDYHWRNEPHKQYSASLWCNATGEHIGAWGANELDAVIAVHNMRAEIEAKQEAGE